MAAATPRLVWLCIGRDSDVIDIHVNQLIETHKLGKFTRKLYTAAEITKQPSLLFDLENRDALFETQELLLVSSVSDSHSDLITAWLRDLSGAPNQRWRVIFQSTTLRSKSKLVQAMNGPTFAAVQNCYDPPDSSELFFASLNTFNHQGMIEQHHRLLLDFSRDLAPESVQSTAAKLSLLINANAELSEETLPSFLHSISGHGPEMNGELTPENILFSSQSGNLSGNLTDEQIHSATSRLASTIQTLLLATANGKPPPWHLRDLAAKLKTSRQQTKKKLENAFRVLTLLEKELRTTKDLSKTALFERQLTRVRKTLLSP